MKTVTKQHQSTKVKRLVNGFPSNVWLMGLSIFFGAWLIACGTDPSTSPERNRPSVHTLVMPGIADINDVGAARSQAEVFRGACDITASVEAFRAALGTLNPNQPGSFGSPIRRGIRTFRR